MGLAFRPLAQTILLLLGNSSWKRIYLTQPKFLECERLSLILVKLPTDSLDTWLSVHNLSSDLLGRPCLP